MKAVFFVHRNGLSNHLIMKNKFEPIIQQLIERDYAVVDNAFNAYSLDLLTNDLLTRYANNRFALAGVGPRQTSQVHEEIRTDEIFWLGKSNTRKAEDDFIKQIEVFIAYLNETCYAGINSYEFHFAVYNPGSFYKRHVDQFKGSDTRKYTVVVYLNKDWTPTMGGQLLIFDGDKKMEIEPVFGRIVVMRSFVEHEVLESHFLRKSVTGWLRS